MYDVSLHFVRTGFPRIVSLTMERERARMGGYGRGWAATEEAGQPAQAYAY